MGQDARSSDAALGLLCKRVTRNKAQLGLDWGRLWAFGALGECLCKCVCVSSCPADSWLCSRCSWTCFTISAQVSMPVFMPCILFQAGADVCACLSKGFQKHLN